MRYTNPMPKSLDLTILILNYNTQDWLRNVLESINTFPPEKLNGEVIVVDNASTDGSPEMVKEEFPRIKLIQSPDNGGFAKGNNLGLSEAKGRYVLLLNSDAEFTEETKIEGMVKYMDEHKKVAVMTPRVELPDGSLDLASHRGEPTPWAALTYFSKLEKLFPNAQLFGQYHQTWKNFDEIHEIEACSGAAMLVRQSAIDKVGQLDDRFFMYAEDLDWCKRFREAGYSIVYYPDSVVIHHKYKSGREKKVGEVIDPAKYLDIPGFPTPESEQTKNSSEHHFWETMQQYYDKHYTQSFFSSLLITGGIQLFKMLKKKR